MNSLRPFDPIDLTGSLRSTGTVAAAGVTARFPRSERGA